MNIKPIVHNKNKLQEISFAKQCELNVANITFSGVNNSQLLFVCLDNFSEGE